MPGGTSVTIGTRQGVKTVTDSAGGNLFPYVSGALWVIASGDNNLRVELSNATTDTTVHLSYRPGYLST